MPQGTLVLTLLKGREKYIVVYNPADKGPALDTLARWASDKELSFSWKDAAMMSQEIRRIEVVEVEP